MLPELPSITTAYHILQQEQKHKEISKMNTTNNDSMVFSVNKRPYYDRNQSRNNHYKQNSSSSFNKSHTNTDFKRHTLYYYEHCKISGHSIERCFKLNGYPPGFKHKKFAGFVNDEAPKIDKPDIGLTPEQL